MDFGNATTAIVSTDTAAVVTGPCLVWGVYQLLNTTSTDTTYELHDALTATGNVKIFSRTTSTPACQMFTRPIRFNTGISVNKTNAGDSKIMIVYEKIAG